PRLGSPEVPGAVGNKHLTVDRRRRYDRDRKRLLWRPRASSAVVRESNRPGHKPHRFINRVIRYNRVRFGESVVGECLQHWLCEAARILAEIAAAECADRGAHRPAYPEVGIDHIFAYAELISVLNTSRRPNLPTDNRRNRGRCCGDEVE